MRRDALLFRSRRFGLDDITERLIRRRTTEAASAPLPQVILYSPLYRLPEDDPGLPHRARHYAYAVELVVSVLWPIAAAHGHRQASDVAPEFEAACGHRVSDDMAEEWIAGDHHVRARHEYVLQRFAELREKNVQPLVIFFRKHGETRKRRALVAIEGRRDAPHATSALPELRLFLFGVFDEAIGRIGHHGVN